MLAMDFLGEPQVRVQQYVYIAFRYSYTSSSTLTWPSQVSHSLQAIKAF